MIAPCGMNCALCIAHLRAVNTCPGCSGSNEQKPQHCVRCGIKNCRELRRSGGKYCCDCEVFPCARLRQLDHRYTTRYGMSMIENLKRIHTAGVQQFVREEEKRWRCPRCRRLISVHRPECIHCGAPRKAGRKKKS